MIEGKEKEMRVHGSQQDINAEREKGRESEVKNGAIQYGGEAKNKKV